jgi:hypothetical protein
MHASTRLRATLALTLSVATLVACGGGAARSSAAAQASAPSDAVARLRIVETPDRIIYTAPASLAKPPDTTAHARKRPN